MHKYQIFVSSTFEDLKPERDQVIKAILEMGHIPVGMEMFSAADEQQWEIIKRQIDQSDYYVVLIAHRYGSMDGDISYTEKEYDYATSKKIPALGFVLDHSCDWPDKWIENNNDIKKRLENFRAKVSSKMVSFWKNPDDLYGRSGIALMKAFSTQPREGWIKASKSNTAEMTAEITRLSRENGELRAKLEATLAHEAEDDSTRINQMIDALRRNKRSIYVWLEGASGWGEPIQTNLLAIFEHIAPELLDEGTYESLGGALSFNYGNGKGRRSFPIPTNYLKSYVADFVGLDLVGTSPKRHSVHDSQNYWALTDLGRKIHSSIRKNELLKGITDFDEDPEALA